MAGITLVVIVAAFLINQEGPNPESRGPVLVFPDLMGKINDVKELSIESREETVTLVRQENAWGIKEKDHYPADMEKVKRSLIGMAELRYREPKTKNPDLYGKLGLLDQKKEGSTSSLVKVQTENSQGSAELLIGDQRPAKGNPTLSEIYVRKPDDPQSWLVTGKLPIEKTATEWLQKDILDVTGTRVQRVRVTHTDGKSLIVEKASPDALDYQIADMPKGYKIQSQFNVNNVVTSLSKLSIDDVQKAEAQDTKAKPSVKAVLETFDGLQVTLETLTKDEKVYGKVTASFDPSLVYKIEESDAQEPAADKDPKEKTEGPMTDASSGGDKKATQEGKDQAQQTSDPPKHKIKPAEEVKEEVAAINQKLKRVGV